MIMMAHFLINRGYNTEFRNPFNYPIKKLIKTYRLNKVLHYTDKNDDLAGLVTAVGMAFGAETTNMFEEQIEKWSE